MYEAFASRTRAGRGGAGRFRQPLVCSPGSVRYGTTRTRPSPGARAVARQTADNDLAVALNRHIVGAVRGAEEIDRDDAARAEARIEREVSVVADDREVGDRRARDLGDQKER
jgi:hypothetical protein